MLLVGGDSFAQFPFDSYGNNGDYEHENDVPDYHWCQALNPDSYSVGIGSADISASTFVTISALSKQSYSHCVFFITTPTREILFKEQHTIDSYVHCLTDPNASLSMKERYRHPQHSIPYNTSSSYVDSNSNSVFLQVGGEFEANEYHTHAIESKHAPMAMHNKVSNLLALKHYCDSNNTKLMFVAPFGPDPINKAISKFYKLDVFYYMTDVFGGFDNYIEKNGSKVMNLMTHHTTKEHDEILNAFKIRFPEWSI